MLLKLQFMWPRLQSHLAQFYELWKSQPYCIVGNPSPGFCKDRRILCFGPVASRAGLSEPCADRPRAMSCGTKKYEAEWLL